MMLTDKISVSLHAAAAQVGAETVKLIRHRRAHRVERLIADTIELDWGNHLPTSVLQLEEKKRA